MSSANILGMVQSVRRITNRTDVTTDANFLSESEIGLYLDDAAGDIRLLYPDFDEFSVSGVTMTPAPDQIDERLLVWGASCLILMDDDAQSSGDAIFIKAGPISLDTSKSLRGFSATTNRMCTTFKNMIDSVVINGKGTDLTNIAGSRVDNYIEDLNSEKDPDAL